VIVRAGALKRRCDSFQTHAGINVLARKRLKILRRVTTTIELRKHQVPDFTFGTVVRMKKDLATRSANTIGPIGRRTSRPKVIVFAQSRNSIQRKTNFFVPNIRSLIVVQIHRHGQPLRIDPQPLLVGQEFPRPMDRVFFEVIPKTEVSQHFKERVVIRGASHVFDVAGSQALLRTGRASEFEFDVTKEMFLERIHPRRCEQDGGIVFGYQHVTGTNVVILGLEKVQILLADLVGFHVSRR